MGLCTSSYTWCARITSGSFSCHRISLAWLARSYTTLFRSCLSTTPGSTEATSVSTHLCIFYQFLVFGRIRDRCTKKLVEIRAVRKRRADWGKVYIRNNMNCFSPWIASSLVGCWRFTAVYCGETQFFFLAQFLFNLRLWLANLLMSTLFNFSDNYSFQNSTHFNLSDNYILFSK